MESFLAYMYMYDYDPNDDEDVKDAIVQMTCDNAHWTDEQLDEAAQEFRLAYGR